MVWRTVSSLAKPSRSSGSFITCRTYHVTDTPNCDSRHRGQICVLTLCILTAHETMLMITCLKSHEQRGRQCIGMLTWKARVGFVSSSKRSMSCFARLASSCRMTDGSLPAAFAHLATCTLHSHDTQSALEHNQLGILQTARLCAVGQVSNSHSFPTMLIAMAS